SAVLLVPMYIRRRALLLSDRVGFKDTLSISDMKNREFEFTEATSGKPDFDVKLEFDTNVRALADFNRSQRGTDLRGSYNSIERHFYYGEIHLPHASGSTRFIIPIVARPLEPRPYHLAPSLSKRRGSFGTAFGALDRAARGLGVLDVKTI